MSLLPSACSSTHSTDELARAEQVAASCPTDGSQIAALVDSDESGSSRGATSNPARQHVIRDVVERTAICRGHLRVVTFSGSMINAIVFDGDLKLDGATSTSRLRKASGAVDRVMEQITAALPDASAQLTDGATDIVGQYQAAAEYQTQLAAAGTVQLELTILTDGIQTAGQNLEDQALTTEQAQLLATTFPVPNLSDAVVRLIGVGRQANGAALSTSYIAALRAFHAAICERTQAATCAVVTDAAGA